MVAPCVAAATSTHRVSLLLPAVSACCCLLYFSVYSMFYSCTLRKVLSFQHAVYLLFVVRVTAPVFLFSFFNFSYSQFMTPRSLSLLRPPSSSSVTASFPLSQQLHSWEQKEIINILSWLKIHKEKTCPFSCNLLYKYSVTIHGLQSESTTWQMLLCDSRQLRSCTWVTHWTGWTSPRI